MKALFHIYLVPAAVFASVVMGGGYGTGREVITFFSSYGHTGGLLGIATAAIVFGVVLAVTFEFARRFRVYDYRSFFQLLLGPFWVSFELLLILMFLLVLGVVTAAAGSIVEEQFRVSVGVGMASMLLIVLILVSLGRSAVETVLTWWSIGMYGVFLLYFFQISAQEAGPQHTEWLAMDTESGWWSGGIRYALYNLAVAPIMLFATRAIKTTRQAVIAGFFTAMCTLFPALLFHLSYSIGPPQVLKVELPNYWMIQNYASAWLLPVFIVALLGTLGETGAGLVHGIIERIDGALGEVGRKPLTFKPRLVVSGCLLLCGGAAGLLGIVPLIAKGYSAMSIAFAMVYVIPVCTLGLFKIVQHQRRLLS